MFLDIRSLLDWVQDAVGLRRFTADHRIDRPTTPQAPPTSPTPHVARPTSDGQR